MTRSSPIRGLLIAGLIIASPATAKSLLPPKPLTLATQVEGRLAPGASARFEVFLTGGMFARFYVEEYSIDVALRLLNSEGSPIASADSAWGNGEESLAFVTTKAGKFLLEITAASGDGRPGRFRVRLEDVHESSDADLRALEPERALRAAELLRSEETRAHNEDAQSEFKRARQLAQREANRRLEGLILTKLGSTQIALGDMKSAAESFEEALRICTAIRDEPCQGQASHSRGVIAVRSGNYADALDHYQHALDLRMRGRDRRSEAATHSDMALLHANWGENAVAFRHYFRALELYRAEGQKLGTGTVLGNIATLYGRYGQPDRALRMLRQALSLRSARVDPRGAGLTLVNIGTIEKQLGRTKDAAASYRRARVQLERVGDRLALAQLTSLSAALSAARGYRRDAVAMYDKAIAALVGLGNRQWEANARLGLATTLADLGRDEHARLELKAVVDVATSLGERRIESQARYRLGLLNLQRGDLDAARGNLETALSLGESLRDGLPTGGLQGSFNASLHDYFEAYLRVLAKMGGRLPQGELLESGFAVSERARARELIALLRRARQARGDDNPDDARLRNLNRTVADREQLQLRLAASGATDRAAAIQVELAGLKDERDRLEASIGWFDGRLLNTLAEPTTLDAVRRSLGPNDVLLEYFLGNKQSFVWAVTSDAAWFAPLPPRAVIERLAGRVHDQLAASFRRHSEVLLDQEIARMAAAILPTTLRESMPLKQRRWIVVPDGRLYDLPFGAIRPRPTRASRLNEYSVQVQLVPSAGLAMALARERGQSATEGIAVFADPVFSQNDSRLRAAVGRKDQSAAEQGNGDATVPFLRRLPASAAEARSIARLAEPGESSVAIGFHATRAAALSPDLRQRRYLHFATHAVVNANDPSLAGVLLSSYAPDGRHINGFLSASDIYGMDLHADLVVLSACDTADGRRAPGEALLTLTQAFLAAGSRSLIVSLWRVDDRATAVLMREFYSRLLKRHLPAARALAEAQAAMSRMPEWRAPYYWQAFVLVGSAS